MEQFYRNLLQGQGRAEALRRAQSALRQMTVRELREDWLSPAMITRLAAGDPGMEFYLEDLADQPDDHRPFSSPRYWGGFICQGMPGPLRAAPRSGARPPSSATGGLLSTARATWPVQTVAAIVRQIAPSFHNSRLARPTFLL